MLHSHFMFTRYTWVSKTISDLSKSIEDSFLPKWISSIIVSVELLLAVELHFDVLIDWRPWIWFRSYQSTVNTWMSALAWKQLNTELKKMDVYCSSKLILCPEFSILCINIYSSGQSDTVGLAIRPNFQLEITLLSKDSLLSYTSKNGLSIAGPAELRLRHLAVVSMQADMSKTYKWSEVSCDCLIFNCAYP